MEGATPWLDTDFKNIVGDACITLEAAGHRPQCATLRSMRERCRPGGTTTLQATRQLRTLYVSSHCRRIDNKNIFGLLLMLLLVWCRVWCWSCFCYILAARVELRVLVHVSAIHSYKRTFRVFVFTVGVVRHASPGISTHHHVRMICDSINRRGRCRLPCNPLQHDFTECGYSWYVSCVLFLCVFFYLLHFIAVQQQIVHVETQLCG